MHSQGTSPWQHSATNASDSRQVDPDNLEDILLCLSYLKQRELFLYKMAEDPSHKAMLYFLELLMNSESALPIALLASKLASRQFTPEMVRAVGENEEGLRRFLARYPSLFALNGNHVSLHDITSFSNTMMLTPTPTPTSATTASTSSTASTLAVSQKALTAATSTPTSSNAALKPVASASESCGEPTPSRLLLLSTATSSSSLVPTQQHRNGAENTVSSPNSASLKSLAASRRFDEDAFVLESEAVRYFTEKLVRRPERWVSIKSLAGHLSQASAEIRQVVGPQSRFRKFLLAQPRVFDVQPDRDLVSLREEIRKEYLAAFPELASAASPSVGVTPTDPVGSQRAAGRPKSLNLGSERNSATSKWLAYSRSRHLASTGTSCKSTTSSRSVDADDVSCGDVEGDAASLLNALGLAECDWTADGATARSSVPGTPLEIDVLSARECSQANGTPNIAVAALRDALTDAARNSAAVRGRRSTIASAGRAVQPPGPGPLSAHSSSSSSSSSETNGNASAAVNARRSKKSAGSQSQPITMTADEYAAVEFVRKFTDRTIKRARQTGDGNVDGDESTGAPIQQLIAALAESGNESVRKVIGWTLTELEAFLKKHGSFFDLSYAPVAKNAAVSTPTAGESAGRLLTVGNKKLSRSTHIIISGGATMREDPCVSGRTMTNRCGRISHVVKLWGIVDLGRHEHVFFDKSIFKHVDDLSKYFRVGQTVWFNAILAPKDSRAKWRATQVWNAADKLLFDRANGNGNGNVCVTPTAASKSPVPAATASATGENVAAAIVEQPKVRISYLADDIRFPADISDSEEDLIKLLDGEPQGRSADTASGPPDCSSSSSSSSCPLVTLADEKTLEMRSGAKPESSLLFATNRDDVRRSDCVVPMPTPLPGDDEPLVVAQHRSAGSGSGRFLLVDAACQTLSTGDILATRLYHDDSS